MPIVITSLLLSTTLACFSGLKAYMKKLAKPRLFLLFLRNKTTKLHLFKKKK